MGKSTGTENITFICGLYSRCHDATRYGLTDNTYSYSEGAFFVSAVHSDVACNILVWMVNIFRWWHRCDYVKCMLHRWNRESETNTLVSTVIPVVRTGSAIFWRATHFSAV